MVRDPFAPPRRAGGTSFRAWAYLITGSVLIIVGAVLPGRDADPLGPISTLNLMRAFLFAGGLLLLGVAIARRLQTAPQDFESRTVTASLLVAAGIGVVLTYIGTPNQLIPSPNQLLEAAIPGKPLARQWDSIRMVLVVMAIVTFVGAFLVLLPVIARKVVVSLLILVHFTSILVSVTSVPPPNSVAPWLSVQAWIYVFRPYSSFMYLNNAYHFYSPEPGPPMLAWFYVRYSDDSGRWIKIPSRTDSPVPLHFQRLLALTESINVINHNTPPNYNELANARRIAGKMYDPEIPLPVEVPPTAAFQPPEEYSRMMISAYARYVARHWPHPDDNPDADVKTVKVYRIVHQIINAPALAAGGNPGDESLDLPYFMGEFDTKGELVDPRDPFLYFWLPIRWENAEARPGEDAKPDGVLRNYLEIHATHRSALEERQP